VEHPSKILRDIGLRPRKSLGQNFLADGNVARKIVSICDVFGKEVLEIGPGLGALTELLIDACTLLVAVEVDPRLADYLRSKLSCDRAKIIHADFLAIDEDELFGFFGGRGEVILVGNLPYSISGPLLFRILSLRKRIGRCCIMLQKEVGERLAASPGGKDYGILSVLFQAVGAVRKLFPVKRTCFYPVPEVDSTVLEIVFDAERDGRISDFALFSELVSAAFGKRRKVLKNSLKDFLGRLGVAPEAGWELLLAAGVDPGARAEEVPVERYVELAEVLRQNRLDKGGGAN